VIDPIALRLGPLEIHWYGVIIATAVLVAGVVGTREARRRGEDPDQGWAMLLPVIVFAVVGARLYHVIHQWDYYSQHLDLIPQIWIGGLGIPGVIMGGALAVVLFTRRAGLSTARWFDIFAPALLLGQAIGRLGNFVNQELYGPPTELPWGIPIDASHRVGDWMNLTLYPVDTTRFHPLFAYEAILNVIGMVVLLWVARRFAARLYDGDVFLLYLVWYGGVRTALENFRTQNWIILGVPTAIWLGIIAIVLAGGFFVLRHMRGWGTPGAWMHRSDDDGDEADAEAGATESVTEPSAG
jgi:phosphatidylglycerol---prolipoprotein diacylglyceryl transferase